jgi:SdrD B-like domain
MSRAWIRVSIALVVAGIFCVGRSSACSCLKTPRDSTCAGIKPIGLSFVGTVIDVENPPDGRRGADQSGLSRYRFRIDENISGFEEKEVDIYSGRGIGDCSFSFRMGESYFVTPYKAQLKDIYGVEPGKLVATLCTETQPTATAGALLKELRARKNGGATVIGLLRTESGTDDYNHRIPNATVELRINDTTLSTQTDREGIYQFNGVPAGRYQFAVILPADFEVATGKASPSPPSVAVSDQPCYTRDIYVAHRVPTRSP